MAREELQASRTEIACDNVWLAVTTLIFLAVCVVNGLSNSPLAPGNFGVINTTEDTSHRYFTQVTPAGYSFSIWGAIYAWQVLLIMYAWSFVCRPKSQRTIFTGVYVSFSIANCLNIAWLYAWGNTFIEVAASLIILLNISLYFSIGLLTGYLHHIRAFISKCDLWCTRIIVLNGMCFYAAWSAVVISTNLTAAIQYKLGLSAVDSATIGLTIQVVQLLPYFLLENTVFDRYGFRYVFSVYPVALWSYSAILFNHWAEEGAERNVTYILVVLIVTATLTLMRILLVVLFTVRRNLQLYN